MLRASSICTTTDLYTFDLRLRLLREEPHSQKAAEAAVGLGTDNGVRTEKGDDMATDS